MAVITVFIVDTVGVCVIKTVAYVPTPTRVAPGELRNLLQVAASALHLIDRQLDEDLRPLVRIGLAAIRQASATAYPEPPHLAPFPDQRFRCDAHPIDPAAGQFLRPIGRRPDNHPSLTEVRF